ncbi:MAG: ABC transporter ATP-binding protein [bacterium]
MIELRNVRKGFNIGKPNEFIAVDGVDLDVEANRVTVLKGPSGSGKTTLLGLIGCMLRPTSGRIKLLSASISWSSGTQTPEGIEVTSLPERFLTDIRRRTFGFIFQQFNLIKGITALENIMLPAYPCKERSAFRKRALELLDLFNISGKGETRVEFLSGGESQRVAIARALINDPAVVIADEPTAHLDTKLSEEFMGIVSQLKTQGKTAIIASHDPLVYESPFVDRVVNIRDGRVEAA